MDLVSEPNDKFSLALYVSEKKSHTLNKSVKVRINSWDLHSDINLGICTDDFWRQLIQYISIIDKQHFSKV